MATPDYILTEDLIITKDLWDQKTILKGTFVRPISYCYVPQHVREASDNKYFQETLEVFAYTPLGIKLVPLNKIRKVSG